MSETQRDAYRHSTTIDSDPLGIIDRDNRNHRKKRQIIVEHMAAEPGDTILEIGCGDGLHAIDYDKHYQYTGIDLSESLAAHTNQLIEDGVALQMDATDLSFEDDYFQATVGTAVWHHMADPVAALEEWRRVTAAGGSITLMEPNYLFPKELIETQVVPEERHKSNMAPWRVRHYLDAVAGVEWTHEPRLYTLPWPHKFFGLYDRIDDVGRKVPGLRWIGLMQLIHGVVQ